MRNEAVVHAQVCDEPHVYMRRGGVVIVTNFVGKRHGYRLTPIDGMFMRRQKRETEGRDAKPKTTLRSTSTSYITKNKKLAVIEEPIKLSC